MNAKERVERRDYGVGRSPADVLVVSHDSRMRNRILELYQQKSIPINLMLRNIAKKWLFLRLGETT